MVSKVLHKTNHLLLFSLWICTFSFLFSRHNSRVFWFPLWLCLLILSPTPYPTHRQCQSPASNLPNLSLILTLAVIISYLVPSKMETIFFTVVCPRLAPYPVLSLSVQWLGGKGKEGKRKPFRGTWVRQRHRGGKRTATAAQCLLILHSSLSSFTTETFVQKVLG